MYSSYFVNRKFTVHQTENPPPLPIVLDVVQLHSVFQIYFKPEFKQFISLVPSIDIKPKNSVRLIENYQW